MRVLRRLPRRRDSPRARLGVDGSRSRNGPTLQGRRRPAVFCQRPERRRRTFSDRVRSGLCIATVVRRRRNRSVSCRSRRRASERRAGPWRRRSTPAGTAGLAGRPIGMCESVARTAVDGLCTVRGTRSVVSTTESVLGTWSRLSTENDDDGPAARRCVRVVTVNVSAAVIDLGDECRSCERPPSTTFHDRYGKYMPMCPGRRTRTHLARCPCSVWSRLSTGERRRGQRPTLSEYHA